MNYIIRVLREGKCEEFLYEGNSEETISAVLDNLNSRDQLYNLKNECVKSIKYAKSCGQGMCGACAMVINGLPRLACKTTLKEINNNIIILEPLSKFPLVKDLLVNRDELYDHPIEQEIYHQTINYDNFELKYEASKCIKCGLCLEVCPNTNKLGANFGALFAADCFVNYDEDNKKRIIKAYNKNFADYCCKALACEKICPMHINLRQIITLMNRK